MKRLKKFLKWTGIVLLLVISILLLTITFLTWRATRQVEARLAPLREAGKPISIQELQPSAVPDQQNSAKIVERHSDALKSFDRQLADATRDIEAETELDAGRIRVAISIAQEFPDLYQALRDASTLPAYQLDLDYSLDPSSFINQSLNPPDSPRTIIRALYGHGLMSLASGMTDEAVEDAIAILNWSQHVAQQPLIINQMVAAACYEQGVKLSAKCLYAGDTTQANRVRLLKACSDDSTMLAHFSTTIDTERAFGISSFESFPSIMLGELAAYLDTISEIETIMKMPTGIAPNTSRESGFGASVWVALKQTLLGLRREQALSRAMQILAAWQDAGGDIGITLADLDLPEAVTIDPYAGSQMKLKVVGQSIKIYSVGMDMVDDDGSIDDDRDIGIAP